MSTASKAKVTLTMFTPEEQIGECAKICYATTTEKDLTHSLVHSHKHLAVLRFAYATVHIEGISIACQNQLVRSKHLDFMVQSKRYVDADKGEFEFIIPDELSVVAEAIMEEHFDSSIQLYKNLLSVGVKKEDARAILPMNTSTKMNVTGNLQAWNDMFKLRLSSKAQKEIRSLANMIYDLLQDKFPQVFTDELRETYSK